MRIVTGLIFLPAQHLVARMHLDLNARDRIRFNQFFVVICVGDRKSDPSEGFEAAVYNAGPSTHVAGQKSADGCEFLAAGQGCGRGLHART